MKFNALDLAQKREYDTLNRVTMKHHLKNKEMKKKNKEKKDIKLGEQIKAEEKAQAIRLKLDAVEEKWNKMKKDVTNKHKKVEQKKNEAQQTISEFKAAKREDNYQRMLEHSEKL